MSPDHERLEARLAALELRLVNQAEELKSQVADRVLRIQSRLESALKPFQTGTERSRRRSEAGTVMETEAKNVVDFIPELSAGVEGRLLHARNAREAMVELNETLRLTREHLEALSGSIERMRRSVSGR